MANPAFLSTAEVAQRLGTSVAMVNRLAQSGKLQPVAKLPGIRGARFYDDTEVTRYEQALADERGAKQAS